MLAPNEPNIDIEHIVVQARGEEQQRLFQVFSRQYGAVGGTSKDAHHTGTEEPGALTGD